MKTVQLLAKPACACLMVFPFAASAQTLQEQIAANPSYPALEQAAYGLLKNGYNAGSHYPEIWIRDLNTFLLPSLEVNPAGELRKNLITTISLQASDGNIPDGYTPDPLVQHKNTVETDQETSLIQAIYKYVNRTGDRTILSENVSGLTVMARMEKALNFLRNFRYSAAHGLIWGGTTADWGDVQPEDIPGTQLNAASHKAVDIYDNAMLVIALGNFLSLANGNATIDAEWRPFLTQIKQNTRTVLWDSANQKFRPHVYLDGSPFPAGFDENAIYYHGGTTVAIEAGILTAQEAAAAFQKMAQNKAAAGANSIGLTLYPTYPQDYFQNGILSTPYTYQNGGDWTWFGARTISQMAQRNALPTAYVELQPMVDRVLNYGADFSEWNALDGSPQGSGTYRGTAGEIGRAPCGCCGCAPRSHSVHPS